MQKGLQGALGAPVYFCHPHHLWERGTNKNANGLLRDWFSKGWISILNATGWPAACKCGTLRKATMLVVQVNVES
ncbi:hypothetical protein [Atopobium sp. oral taxon 416]|uniref:hypothetical protein n=1 Tax=Atopobium sp. oral taxon 416 TaxID=712157 RepID=UPI001BA8B047|nr:hypothetical protein [Atopobium sp. oral taxon 416]QUC02172.1 hypothetical protein J4859_08890 [Atopobium sp. oral taxon 416]